MVSEAGGHVTSDVCDTPPGFAEDNLARPRARPRPYAAAGPNSSPSTIATDSDTAHARPQTASARFVLV